MKRNQIADEFGIAGSGCGRFLTVDPPLDIQCPFFGVLSAAESFVDIFPLAPNLGTP
jgi:hypothetical protein